MAPIQIIFIVAALLTLGSALIVVTTRNLIHAALWLVVALLGVAILYVLLNAGFLAVVQVVVYIGAISILMIFAVMLTRRVMEDTGPQTHAYWWLPALIAAAIFGGLTWVLTRWEGAAVAAAPELAAGVDPIVELGQALVSPDAYVIPFEVASVLLLAAMIGAIYVAWDKN